MTRDEAERLVSTGAARWDGDALVYLRPPSGGDKPVRVRWPGWRRMSNGEWIREGEPR